MWKDVSSYSQGDTDRTPKSFELKTGGLKIVVTRHIHHDTDAWILRCPPWFNDSEVGKGTIEDAKREAVLLVRHKLTAALAELGA